MMNPHTVKNEQVRESFKEVLEVLSNVEMDRGSHRAGTILKHLSKQDHNNEIELAYTIYDVYEDHMKTVHTTMKRLILEDLKRRLDNMPVEKVIEDIDKELLVLEEEEI